MADSKGDEKLTAIKSDVPDQKSEDTDSSIVQVDLTGSDDSGREVDTPPEGQAAYASPTVGGDEKASVPQQMDNKTSTPEEVKLENVEIAEGSFNLGEHMLFDESDKEISYNPRTITPVFENGAKAEGIDQKRDVSPMRLQKSKVSDNHTNGIDLAISKEIPNQPFDARPKELAAAKADVKPLDVRPKVRKIERPDRKRDDEVKVKYMHVQGEPMQENLLYGADVINKYRRENAQMSHNMMRLEEEMRMVKENTRRTEENVFRLNRESAMRQRELDMGLDYVYSLDDKNKNIWPESIVRQMEDNATLEKTVERNKQKGKNMSSDEIDKFKGVVTDLEKTLRKCKKTTEDVDDQEEEDLGIPVELLEQVNMCQGLIAELRNKSKMKKKSETQPIPSQPRLENPPVDSTTRVTQPAVVSQTPQPQVPTVQTLDESNF